jgi:hypothetical protein
MLIRNLNIANTRSKNPYRRSRIKVLMVVAAPTMMDTNPNQSNRSSLHSLSLLAGAEGTQVLPLSLTIEQLRIPKKLWLPLTCSLA